MSVLTVTMCCFICSEIVFVRLYAELFLYALLYDVNLCHRSIIFACRLLYLVKYFRKVIDYYFRQAFALYFSKGRILDYTIAEQGPCDTSNYLQTIRRRSSGPYELTTDLHRMWREAF